MKSKTGRTGQQYPITTTTVAAVAMHSSNNSNTKNANTTFSSSHQNNNKHGKYGCSKKQSTKSSLKKQKILNKHDNSISSATTSFPSMITGKHLFYGMIVLYVAIALSFCLQYVISPERARQLTQASLGSIQPTNGGFNRHSQLQHLNVAQYDMKMASTYSSTTKTKISRIENGDIYYTLEYNVRINKTNDSKYTYVTCDLADVFPDGKIPYGRDIVILNGQRYVEKYFGLTKDSYLPVDDIYHDRPFAELCHQSNSRGFISSITAINILEPISSDELINIIQQMISNNAIKTPGPLAAIITPDQSSTTILDWIQYGDIYKLTKQVAISWIPYNFYINPEEEDYSSYLHSVKDKWPIFSIYGENNVQGMIGSNFLKEHAGAYAHTITGGGIDVDKDKAEIFARDILDFLESLLPGAKKHSKVIWEDVRHVKPLEESDINRMKTSSEQQQQHRTLPGE